MKEIITMTKENEKTLQRTIKNILDVLAIQDMQIEQLLKSTAKLEIKLDNLNDKYNKKGV